MKYCDADLALSTALPHNDNETLTKINADFVFTLRDLMTQAEQLPIHWFSYHMEIDRN